MMMTIMIMMMLIIFVFNTVQNGYNHDKTKTRNVLASIDMDINVIVAEKK